MKITILIPSHNRRASLARALESLDAIKMPAGSEIEIVVVASACSDDTVDWLERYSGKLPLRLIVETRPGVARARNAALDQIESDVILFFDDDVTVEPDIALVYQAAMDLHPDVDCFGGAIFSRLEGKPRPVIRDIARLLPTTYSQLWLGPEPRLMDPRQESPFGANMAIRTLALAGRRFDESLGRMGNGDLSAGEETHLFEELCRAGIKSLWLPDARVGHWIHPGSQTMEYARRYWYHVGVMQMRLGHVKTQDVNTDLRQRLKLEAKFRLARLTKAPEIWLPKFLSLMLLRGQCAAIKMAKQEAGRQ